MKRILPGNFSCWQLGAGIVIAHQKDTKCRRNSARQAASLEDTNKVAFRIETFQMCTPAWLMSCDSVTGGLEYYSKMLSGPTASVVYNTVSHFLISGAVNQIG